MKFATWRQDASNRARASLSVRVGAAMLILALAAGCHGQLAHKHDFFAPGSAAGTRNQVETQRVLAYYQALQAAQHGCPGGRPAAAIGDDASLDSARRRRATGFAAALGAFLSRRGGQSRRTWRSRQQLPALGGGSSASAA